MRGVSIWRVCADDGSAMRSRAKRADKNPRVLPEARSKCRSHGHPRAPRKSDLVFLLLSRVPWMARSSWSPGWLGARRRVDGSGSAAYCEPRSPALRAAPKALPGDFGGRCGRTRCWGGLVPAEAAGVNSILPQHKRVNEMREESSGSAWLVIVRISVRRHFLNFLSVGE